MFIWTKTAKRLEKIEKRLDRNADLIQEDHNRLVELEEVSKRLTESFDKCDETIQGLIRNIAKMNRRLNALREAISEALDENG